MDGRTMFNVMKKATKTAFDRTTKMAGQQTDPDLSLYEQLEPQDFFALMKDYGEGDVIRYIQKMESKRIVGK